MKRSLILMTLLVISSLMVAPALAETLATQTYLAGVCCGSRGNRIDCYCHRSNRIKQKVIVRKIDTKRNMAVIGNKDTKGYHVFGMPSYTRVKKNHRIYFKSEKQAIANGYYKAGTGKDLQGSLSPSNEKKRNNHNILMAADSAGSEKSVQEALQKNEKILETKTQDTPKTVEEPQTLSGENVQKETVKQRNGNG